jgi:UDP-N-acetylmuramoylalanine--D-glutamate ligase
VVVGLGQSGLSTVRTLMALGATATVSDSRADPPGLAALRAEFPELSCQLGGFDPMLFRDAARLIVSPGVAVQTPAIAEAAARGVPIWGDIELLARLTQAPIAAITGTNGKSTVTSLLGAMAESRWSASGGGRQSRPPSAGVMAAR